MEEGRAATSWAERASRWSSCFETALLTVMVVAMVGLAGWQILMRNLGMPILSWADEALRILVLWVTMVGAVTACREQRHVNIDALSRYLPGSWKPWTGLVTNAFSALICLILAWASWRFLAGSAAIDDRLFAGQVPAWVVQSVMPASFALLALFYGMACLRPRVEAERAARREKAKS